MSLLLYVHAHAYNTYSITECKMDSVFVLDVSVSIGNDSNFERITNFCVKLIQATKDQGIDAKFATILFARHAWIHFKINDTTITNATEAIASIQYSKVLNKDIDHKGTNIPEALELLRVAGENGSLGLRNESDYKSVVFVTDGRTNTLDLEKEKLGLTSALRGAKKNKHLKKDENNTLINAQKLHRSGVYDQVFAIGIKAKSDISKKQLDAIDSANNAILVEGFNETNDAFENIQELFCDREYNT